MSPWQRAAAVCPGVESDKKSTWCALGRGSRTNSPYFFNDAALSSHKKKKKKEPLLVFFFPPHNLHLTRTLTRASNYSVIQKHEYAKLLPLLNTPAVVYRMVQKYALCHERWLHSLFECLFLQSYGLCYEINTIRVFLLRVSLDQQQHSLRP